MANYDYQTLQMGEDEDGEEDLVNELLDNRSPFFLGPSENYRQGQHPLDASLLPGKLPIPAVYSGPTLNDIEFALSSSFQSRRKDAVADHQARSPLSLVQLEKLLGSKKENKYTLTVKSSAAGVADDGYKWRKYGQKSIKSRANPRSYYRCTNPRCSAKKQVERSTEDPDLFIITYEGLHLHYAYPSILAHPHPAQAGSTTKENPRSVDQRGGSRLSGLPSPAPSAVANANAVLRLDEEGDIGSWMALQDERIKLVDHGILPSFPHQAIPLDSYASQNLRASSPPSSSSSSCQSWSPMQYSSFDLGLLSNSTGTIL